MNEGIKRFWMVKRDGYGPCNIQHTTRWTAIGEAQRLARENPDASFYVLEAIGVAKVAPPPVRYFDFNEPEPPF